MRTYFLRNGKRVSGPFTLSMLQKQAFYASTEVRHEGLPGWITADHVEELHPILTGTSAGSANPGKENAETLPVKHHPRTGKIPREVSVVAIALVIALSISTVGWLRQPVRQPEVRASMPHTIATAPVVMKQESVAPMPPEKKEIIPLPPPIDKEKKARKNWLKTIRVVNSNYAYGTIGGINDLSLNFINGTDYPLEEVTAKISYIKSNGKVWKTKLVTVTNLAPQSQRKEAVAKVARGKSIKVTVYSIRSKKMQFCYEEGRSTSDRPDDPYYCH